jgi:hypothetical protein
MSSENRLGVRPITASGRGVIAYHHINANECLERAQTFQFDARQSGLLKELGLGDACFIHPADPKGALLVLGLASLCNCSEEPNTLTVASKDGGAGWVIEMHSLRDIRPGEEITRRHTCDQWFDLADEEEIVEVEQANSKYGRRSGLRVMPVMALRTDH